MLAHVRGQQFLQQFSAGRGWLTLADGRKVSPPVAGFVDGDDRVLPVENETVDNSTGADTVSTTEMIVETSRVLRRTIITDAPPRVYKDIASAEEAMVDWIDTFTLSLTGPVPDDEKLAWPIKEAAARAYKAASADIAQTAIIEGEAKITGERPTDLADTIIAKADLYRAVVIQMAGLRRKTKSALAASTPEQYGVILQAAMAEAESAKTALGIT